MDIDIATLRVLEREKEVPFDVLVRAIEQALLLGYHRTEGAQPQARVELDRTSGHVVVWAREEQPDGTTREVDDTPEGFGRIAATTARQAILQRLRDLEDEHVLGEFSGFEGDIVAGVVQQSSDPRMVHVDLGAVEGLLPPQEQVPGETYAHGTRLRCYVVAVEAGGETVVVPDPRHGLAGRGAWLHPDPSCLDLAERRRAFPRALRRAGPLGAIAVREFVARRASPPANVTTTDRPHESGSEADEHPMSTQL